MRLFNSCVKIAAWATPHVQKMARESHLNEEHAERHFEARNYDQAEKYYSAAIEDAERRHASLKNRTALRLQLAEARRLQGNTEGAVAVVNEAISKTGRSGALYGSCLEKLSAIHSQRGEDTEALTAGRAALEIARKQHLAPQIIAERCYRLATIEQRCGNSERQKELLQESLSLYEKAFGAQHVETANRLTDMGVAMRNEGSFTEALVFLEKACGVHKQLLGTDSPEYATDVEHLAATQQALGNVQEAVQLYDRLLRLKENQLGLDPAPYGCLLVGAAELYVAANLEARAYETIQHALRLLDRQKALSEVGERVANVLEAVGRPGDLEKFARRLDSLATKTPAK